jgi:membrane dipeptidase
MKITLKTFVFLFLTSCTLAVMAKGEKDQKLWKKAQKIHEQVITVDTHCDTPWALLGSDFNIAEKHSVPKSRVDLPRMKEGGLDAEFFAVFTGQKPRTEENYREAYNKANQMLDSIHSMVDRHSDLAELALTAGDASRIEKTGKRAIYIGMENGFPLDKDINRVQEFYNRGVRYITLCHSFHNDICDSSSDPGTPEHNGLSEFGKKVVAEMNRLGMMIDVSHASDQSFFDAIKYSKAPVIASHSSVRPVCNHDRNMSDEMLRALAKNGGVIQICLLDAYIRKPDTTKTGYKLGQNLKKTFRTKYKTMTDTEKQKFSEQWEHVYNNYMDDLPNVKDVVNHIDYVKKLIGVDYVGIGSDFDGGGGLAGCIDVSQFPNITYELLKRGYTEKEIKKIWGGNFLRVFSEVEKVAKILN